jgi:hypothetical protein
VIAVEHVTARHSIHSKASKSETVSITWLFPCDHSKSLKLAKYNAEREGGYASLCCLLWLLCFLRADPESY